MVPKPVLYALLACSLSFAQTNVLLMPKPEPVVAKAGSTLEVRLPLQLRDGYHMNSNMPPDPYLVPLRLTWETGPFTGAEVVYPKPSLRKVEFFPAPLPVFSGRLELVTRFKVAASVTPGLVNVPGKIRY